jgi:hypothetical protein
MRLEHLCDMELDYREESLYHAKVVRVRPYGSLESSAYGEGDGVVTGERLAGRARWVNHPHGRSDHVYLPNLHGIIQTEDGASILFSLHGRTIFGEDDRGHLLLSVTFETDDERYRWLNQGLCVLEGMMDAAGTHTHIFQCINELD